MTDHDLRTLERAAAQGDAHAAEHLARARLRLRPELGETAWVRTWPEVVTGRTAHAWRPVVGLAPRPAGTEHPTLCGLSQIIFRETLAERQHAAWDRDDMRACTRCLAALRRGERALTRLEVAAQGDPGGLGPALRWIPDGPPARPRGA